MQTAFRSSLIENMAEKREKISKLSQIAAGELGLSAQVRGPLREVIEELEGAYRDRFLELAEAIAKQASALDRIQRTLELLVRHAKLDALSSSIPAIRLAEPGESPDVATVLVDPIGAGFALSQQQIADALNISQADVSILLRGFKLRDDPQCAVVVRKGPIKHGGKSHESVNYHRRAVEKLRRLIEAPPPSLSKDVAGALKRARKRLTP